MIFMINLDTIIIYLNKFLQKWVAVAHQINNIRKNNTI